MSVNSLISSKLKRLSVAGVAWRGGRDVGPRVEGLGGLGGGLYSGNVAENPRSQWLILFVSNGQPLSEITEVFTYVYLM